MHLPNPYFQGLLVLNSLGRKQKHLRTVKYIYKYLTPEVMYKAPAKVIDNAADPGLSYSGGYIPKRGLVQLMRDLFSLYSMSVTGKGRIDVSSLQHPRPRVYIRPQHDTEIVSLTPTGLDRGTLIRGEMATTWFELDLSNKMYDLLSESLVKATYGSNSPLVVPKEVAARRKELKAESRWVQRSQPSGNRLDMLLNFHFRTPKDAVDYARNRESLLRLRVYGPKGMSPAELVRLHQKLV